MRNLSGYISLREHFRIVRDDHTLGDFRRDLVAMRKDGLGELSCLRILGQRDCGNV